MTIHDDHIHLRPHVEPQPPHELTAALQAARAAGVVPGIREHPPLPLPYRIGPRQNYGYAMHPDEADGFFELLAGAGCAAGFEFDYIAGHEQEQERILADMQDRAAAAGVPLSGITGSVHFLPGYGISDVDYDKHGIETVMWDLDERVFAELYSAGGPARILRDYFGAMRELVGTGLFDTLGHIDLIRKFDAVGANGRRVYFGDVEDLYLQLSRGVIEMLSDSPMTLEINTSGIFSRLGRPYISQELLDYAVELGVSLSYGSDAHRAQDVGAGFEVAARMLETAGRETLVTFVNREAVEYSPFE